MSQNRRRYDRLPVDLPGAYKILDHPGAGHFHATVVNLTPEGLCLTVREDISNGSHGQIQLEYENGEKGLLSFQVVWVKKFEVGRGNRIGARIIKEEAIADHPQVITWPPLIYLGFLLGAWLVGHFWPLPLQLREANQPLGWLLIILGLFVIASGVRQMTKAGTPVNPRQSTRTLVINGVFHYSRNPLYISLTLIYLGLAVLSQNAWPIIFLVPLLVVVHYGVILKEESYLEKKFGEEYLEYKRTVRRWL